MSNMIFRLLFAHKLYGRYIAFYNINTVYPCTHIYLHKLLIGTIYLNENIIRKIINKLKNSHYYFGKWAINGKHVRFKCR